MKLDVICVAGPTATGKTALAVALAKTFGGQVISADSMQVYKGMDIGTAKPDMNERGGIAHHMMDIITPDTEFSAALFKERALQCIEQVQAQDNVPILAGGTGHYIQQILNQSTLPPVPPNPQLRERMYTLAQSEEGKRELHERLAKIDPESAKKIHQNDVKRVARAIEVYETAKKPLSQINREGRDALQTGENSVIIGLNYQNRQTLYDKINARVDVMLQNGLEAEARAVYQTNLSKTAAQAIGYKELFAYFDDRITKEQAVEQIKQESRRYAKRQLTWFGANKNIFWIYVDEHSPGEIVQISTNYLTTKGYNCLGRAEPGDD